MDITTIEAYLVGNHSEDMSTDTLVEVKKGRALKDDEAEESISKKKSPSSREAIPSGESLANCIC